MPTIVPGDKVLVTGSNGYIAVWVVRTLLEQGYSVRGTVRSADKGQYLDEMFGKTYAGKLEIVVVEDIIKVRCELATLMKGVGL
jgi:nucleoside-diphosphate-sugar epimerase